MADLDNFFAKKSKKKAKPGKKASAPSEATESNSTVQKDEEENPSFVRNNFINELYYEVIM